MAFTEINGVRYHYELVGDGPPLVLLHGFTGSLENWRPLVDNLKDHYTLLTVDLLGHGQTAAPPDAHRYSMASVAEDVIGLIDATIGKSCHLLGYSMGGRLALYIAVHYPAKINVLILESASPGLSTELERAPRRQRDDELASWIETEGIERFVDYWEKLPLFASQQRLPTDIRARLRSQRLKNNPVGLANSLRGMGTGAQPSLWDKLRLLEIPALLLVGVLDTKFVGIAQQMYDLLPQAQLQIIPDAGHTLHLEAPAQYQNLIQNRLEARNVDY